MFRLMFHLISDSTSDVVHQVRRQGKNNDYDHSKIGGRLASGVTQKMIIVIGIMLFATNMLEILSSEEDAELSVATSTLLSLHQRCRNLSNSSGSNNSVGCPTQADCKGYTPDAGAACHFNLYLRQVIVDLNGDFGGACPRRKFDSDLDWRTCKLWQFDALYDWDTYTFHGDCLKQHLRHLRVGTSEVRCP